MNDFLKLLLASLLGALIGAGITAYFGGNSADPIKVGEYTACLTRVPVYGDTAEYDEVVTPNSGIYKRCEALKP